MTYTPPNWDAVNFILQEYIVPNWDSCYFELVAFPTQYSGLRAQIGSAMQELCLVAAGDGNSDITGRPRISKGGTVYDIYLVETTDADGSAIRIQTPSGIKAIRKKT